MSQVLRIGSFVIYIYENDHNPRHVHVFQGSATGPEIEINLNDLTICSNYMNDSDTRKAHKIVKKNRDFLIKEWDRIGPKL